MMNEAPADTAFDKLLKLRDQLSRSTHVMESDELSNDDLWALAAAGVLEIRAQARCPDGHLFWEDTLRDSAIIRDMHSVSPSWRRVHPSVHGACVMCEDPDQHDWVGYRTTFEFWATRAFVQATKPNPPPLTEFQAGGVYLSPEGAPYLACSLPLPWPHGVGLFSMATGEPISKPTVDGWKVQKQPPSKA